MTKRKFYVPLFMLATFVIIECNYTRTTKRNSTKNVRKHNGIELKSPKRTDMENKLEIYVYQDGRLEIDGKVSNYEKLDSALKLLKSRGGFVYYSREEGKREPSQKAIKIFKRIVDAELPIKLYRDREFKVPVKP